MKAVPLFLLTILSSFITIPLLAIDSKGAIIIANLVGDVEVVNNSTQVVLAADKVKVGGVLMEGHTVKASAGSKAVLLMSSGTILTVRENSVINLQKF